MKLEFKKRELEIDLYGELIKMSFPTVNQFKVYQSKLKKIDGENDEIQIMLDFLTDLGMPEGKTDDMEPEHLKEILEVLSGSKKK